MQLSLQVGACFATAFFGGSATRAYTPHTCAARSVTPALLLLCYCVCMAHEYSTCRWRGVLGHPQAWWRWSFGGAGHQTSAKSDLSASGAHLDHCAGWRRLGGESNEGAAADDAPGDGITRYTNRCVVQGGAAAGDSGGDEAYTSSLRPHTRVG